ncbi:hypothetical protein GCM10020358_68060 [Amorphoplanes nipponensis]|uniref:Uncharacterized protein n=1 Tax=Actinoplanes nipponensis TaxID=135950 RepID=A0A919JLS9_9ACTN|nr:hypothetical protein [Actinoplanes nipponensis]GIE51570.1 hypothetical protein Ani05nite_51040 [Actinoplanes nipponensis]
MQDDLDCSLPSDVGERTDEVHDDQYCFVDGVLFRQAVPDILEDHLECLVGRLRNEFLQGVLDCLEMFRTRPRFADQSGGYSDEVRAAVFFWGGVVEPAK